MVRDFLWRAWAEEHELTRSHAQNILDALSYGLITYPASVPAFANFGGIGYSQFFVSCV